MLPTWLLFLYSLCSEVVLHPLNIFLAGYYIVRKMILENDHTGVIESAATAACLNAPPENIAVERAILHHLWPYRQTVDC